MRRLTVCFVCSGNICRSPIAEKAFAAAVAGAGLARRVRVSSAGLGDWHVGGPADDRTTALLRRNGLDTAHVARQVDPECLSADLIVALDGGHLRALRRAVGDGTGDGTGDRIRLLRSFDPAAAPGAEVPDPYWGGRDDFDEVLEMVNNAVPGLLNWVREHVADVEEAR
jgi:protein-tyrosine phosphatase